MILDEDQPQHNRSIIPKTIDKTIPWAYFDESTQNIGCGCGVVLYLSEDHYLKMKMGLGRGTNNYS